MMTKFIGYEYREKPSPHRVPVFIIDKELTLEELKLLQEDKEHEGGRR